MTDINNPSETVPDANDVVASVGNENVSNSDSLTLEEINSTLGRSYADKPTALKALKETFSFVGKKSEPNPNTVQSDDNAQATSSAIEEIQKKLRISDFYASNPDYNNADAKELINSFQGEPEEIVKSDVFQRAYKAIKSESINDKSQTVMQSNSRVAGSDADYQADFEKAQTTGDWGAFLSKHKGIDLQE